MPDLPDDDCSGLEGLERSHKETMFFPKSNFREPRRAAPWSAGLRAGSRRGYRPMGLPAGLRYCDHRFPGPRFSYFFFLSPHQVPAVLPAPSDCVCVGPGCLPASSRCSHFSRHAQRYTGKLQLCKVTIFPLRTSSLTRAVITKRSNGIKF